MVISGLCINVLPARIEEVKQQLADIPQMEIHTVIDNYKIVVVIETGSIDEEIAISKRISRMEGVLGINLAYHHFGDPEAEE
jgi:nitrate reductase NapD